MYRLLVLIFCLYVCCSCNNKTIEIPKKIETHIDLPKTNYTEPTRDYTNYKSIINNLGLNDIELGTDSFELRIYDQDSWWTSDNLIVLKYINDSLSVRLFQFSAVPLGSPPHLEVDSFYSKRILPKISFKQLMDSLDFYKSYSLKSTNEENGVFDGNYFTLEIGTKSKYFLYRFYCPDHIEGESNKEASKLLYFISRQIYKLRIC